MATQKKNVVPAQKETTSSSSISQNNDTPKTANQSSGTGRTRNYAKLVYPTKEQYEKWYAEHSTYCDEETGEIKETPHYDGADGYGQAPDNWIEILKESHVACLVSPLHALDRLPDHTLKKPHYHVMLMFDGVKSQKQADEIFDRVAGVGKEEIGSMRGYARYMQQLDKPEKYRYKDKPLCIGGVDYNALIHLPGDDTVNVKDMMRYIRVNQISSFAQFCDICALNNDEWFNSLVHRTSYIIKEYIKSVEWERKNSV